MATLTQIRNKVDGVLTTLAPTIDNRQVTYFANNNQYWQGKWTHTTEPVDGVDTAPNNLTDTPTNISVRWNQILQGVELPAQLPMRIRCDVYEAPGGWGYVLTAQVKLLNGDVWQRTSNRVGPETWRTQGWHQVILTPP
jgi:hypothetical protein